MSVSFETVKSIFDATPQLPQLLRDADRYWAHVHLKYPSELYEEHFERVNRHFALVCEKNELDCIIDNLIIDYANTLFPKSDKQIIGQYIKRLFVHTAIFHDFGKVNENFQGHPKKMNNPYFKMRRDNPLKHHHSKLGAYLFVVWHFEEIRRLILENREEQRQLFLTILLFSYPIFKHHASGLLRPDAQGIHFEPEELAWMKKYLNCYYLTPDERILGSLLERKALEQQFFDWVFKENRIKFDFSFFALLRLNFSPNPFDYHTGEYRYQLKLETDADWGILSGAKRESLIEAPKTNPDPGKKYNVEAYQLYEAVKRGRITLRDPKTELLDTSSENLNILRTEMAVSVLQTLEKCKDDRLFYLEAPTGGGKTNLSMLAVAELLRADERLTKVFYVFPFTTLITQTHQAIQETLLLDDTQIALLHSRAGFQTTNSTTELNDEADAVYGNQRKDFLQNLFALYPFTLITHVRFFDIIKSNRKDDIYLMHRLANSVVVLDELQSYPPRQWDKMLYLLDQYGRYFNIRFLLMSATLPRLTEIEAVQRASGKLPGVVDLLPNAKAYFQNPNFRDRVSFKFDLLKQGDLTADDLAIVVLEKSLRRAEAQQGRVFTIVEFIFKKSATEFKNVLDRFEPFFDEIFVLSGTILENRRHEIINYLKRQRKATGLKLLLITTQVVEAGVDIDMDLGFKNISLIDSDEQLAGRVNRNVGKEDCEVWLFRKDDASVLYGSDFRFKVTRELSRNHPEFHREVLETKDFGKLYSRVFSEIEKRNQSGVVENFESDYLNLLQKLDFQQVHDKFKIIDQKTLSVFVPVSLPITIENSEGEAEPFFNKFELEFLRKAIQYDVLSENGKMVNGEGVWKFYREILSNPNSDFIAKKVEQKVMQGILAKFTFSMFSSPKNRERLASNSDPDLGFEDYYYLHRWKEDAIYSLESGLDESKMEEPFI
ncbi:MAG: CRISPR-associated helicase Cas3' [Lewinellaceae bacterium]|nr:CRISPR-associated helicase Cas3' [Lewinellaceae bacterium]